MRTDRVRCGLPVQFAAMLGLMTVLFEGPRDCQADSRGAPERPNIIFILADDLGYGELGCYGQKLIQTPHIDRMAGEGMRFTQFYAGATVCAPSRSVLMTGQHQGHTRVRGNAGRANPLAQALAPDEMTVARLLKAAGYRTALIGKWGLGDVGPAEVGLPRRQGFDYFFGYLSQHHAHNHYPDFLWRNEDRVPLSNKVVPIGGDGGGYATEPRQYADDLFAQEAIEFVKNRRSEPFFLYWSLVVPHANNERTRELKDGAEVPDYGPYADRPWSNPTKGHAAMISRMDGYVGRLLAELKRLGIDRRTLVLFSSDNGPHRESNHDIQLFAPSGLVRGYKRDLYDGGIRVPFIAWWPGKVAPGSESNHVGYFGDFLATAGELAGATLPPDRDSISFVPALVGEPQRQRRHEYLYWEFHESGFSQAVLMEGRWKAIRNKRPDSPIELYDLTADPREERDLAAELPDRVRRARELLQTARSDSPLWPVRPAAKAKQ